MESQGPATEDLFPQTQKEVEDPFASVGQEDVDAQNEPAELESPHEPGQDVPSDIEITPEHPQTEAFLAAHESAPAAELLEPDLGYHDYEHDRGDGVSPNTRHTGDSDLDDSGGLALDVDPGAMRIEPVALEQRDELFSAEILAETTPANEAAAADFSALLAEFDADGGDLLPVDEEDLVEAKPAEIPFGEPIGIPTSTPPDDQPPQEPDLFANDAGLDAPNPFDELLNDAGPQATSTPPLESPVPELSIEQDHPQAQPYTTNGLATADTSMFSNASDWLADTTMDESMVTSVQPPQSPAAKELETGHAGDAHLAFEVPQGWYDESGQWNWYTEEEKEDVRRAMLAEGDAVPSPPIAHDEPTQDFSPGLAARPTFERGNSENLARRTPQPEQPAVMSSYNYDPYAPSSATQPGSTQPTVSNARQQQYDPYAPGPAPLDRPAPATTASYAYGTPASAYDPYAPTTSTAPLNSYASSSSSFLHGPSQSTVPPIVQKAPAPAQKPAAPKRVVSNAYDPPLLSKKKTVARSVSAAPLIPSGFSAFGAPPVPPLPDTVPARAMPTPPPPTGPPRRAKTPAGPTILPPPPPQSFSTRKESFSRDSTISGHQDPPLRPPSRPSTVGAGARPAPASDNSFDPPMKPSGSHRPPSQPRSPLPDFAPPPPAAVSPTRRDSSIRPSGRGSFGKASPMYEHPPPPRPYPTQRPPRPTSQHHDRQESFSGRPAFLDEYENGSPQAPEFVHDEGRMSYGSPATSDVYLPRQTFSQRSISPPMPATGYQPHPPYPSQAVSPPTISQTLQQPSSLGLQQAAQYHSAPPQSSYDPYSPPSAPHASLNTQRPPPPADPYAAAGRGRRSPLPAAPPRPPSTTSYDPYAPSGMSAQQPQSRPSFYAGHDVPEPGLAPARKSLDETYVPQQVLEQRPVSEDPLGRCNMDARNIPLAVFGFGGTLVSAFPATAEGGHSGQGHSRTMSYGYASGRGQVWIRTIADLASTSALISSETTFPGPLLLDPATPKGAAGDKKKRDAVTTYLTARAEEIESGLPYLKSSASGARRQAEGKLVLVKLLSAMIKGDGRLSASGPVGDAVREALQTVASKGKPFAPSQSPVNGLSGLPNRNAPSVAASESQLSELSTMLAGGAKQEAVQFASEVGLWSHALIIASSVDPDLWAETVSRFAAAELAHMGGATSGLRAAYALFSGATPRTVDDLMAAANITSDPSHDQWREVISSIFFNGKPTDQLCLDDLGHRLFSAGFTEAAQVCFLLAPSAPFADSTAAAFDKPIMLAELGHDEDSVIFAEVAEYARSLLPVAKGQETGIVGLPSLLHHKLQRAWIAAELGEVEVAQRYCNAISASSRPVKGGAALLAPAHAASLEDLLERLTGTPSIDPPTAIGSRRAPKPGLDKLGSWIEGRLTKFIAGDEPDAKPASKPAPAQGDVPVGPFSHFSTISPNPSMPITRATSSTDMSGNGHLSVRSSTSARLSPGPEMSAYSAYGGGWSGFGGEQQDDDDATPHVGASPETEEAAGEFINPMAALSLGPSTSSNDTDSYKPSSRHLAVSEDDDDDLGFGNSSLSRSRTPQQPGEAGKPDSKAPAPPAATSTAGPAQSTQQADNASPAKSESKGWLRGWFSKGEGSGGPIKAKLGEESSMVYDNDLKRWVVKGAKGEVTPPPQLAPPPRAQTASPSKVVREVGAQRAMSATPPPSNLRMTSSPGHLDGPDTSMPRMKSSLHESVTASDVSSDGQHRPTPPHSGGVGAPPRMGQTPPVSAAGPPSRPATANIDDLLSRPPSSRPGAKGKRAAKGKYVDVFQGQG